MQKIQKSIKSIASGFHLFFVRRPKIALRHAHNLKEIGHEDKAVELYSTVRQTMLQDKYSQEIDFKLSRAQWEIGSGSLKDPLFLCRVHTFLVENARTSDGKVRVEFGFNGLKIRGQVIINRRNIGLERPEHVNIMINDKVLRKERLTFKSYAFAGDRAKFEISVRRSTVALCPQTSILSFRLSNGTYIRSPEGGTHFKLQIPHGSGGILERLEATGPIDKKGYLRPSSEHALHRKQDDYLRLYHRARKAFETELGRPLFLLYGTLLGQHRAGDFIPGDDDFDVGYVSEYTDLQAVKTEAIEIIERLIELGFTIVLNRKGKPHRIQDDTIGTDVHLSNRPVFTLNDGKVWMHQVARLNMDLDDFRQVETGLLRGEIICKPRGTEEFLATYYGPTWRVPDPSFSNSSKTVSPAVKRSLSSICLTHAEQKALLARVQKRKLPGRFIPMALYSLYPLEDYLRDVGP